MKTTNPRFILPFLLAFLLLSSHSFAQENGSTASQPHLIITQESDIPPTLPEDSVSTVYDTILKNISNILYDEAGSYSTISANAQNYLDKIQADGSWADLTYTGDVRTTHLDRLKTMALAYTNGQSALYGNMALYTAI